MAWIVIFLMYALELSLLSMGLRQVKETKERSVAGVTGFVLSEHPSLPEHPLSTEWMFWVGQRVCSGVHYTF